jgi:hypothetical protein
MACCLRQQDVLWVAGNSTLDIAGGSRFRCHVLWILAYMVQCEVQMSHAL